jgi:hypothetical protein
MPISQSILSYPDVKEVFERALASQRGVRIPLKDSKTAQYFSRRCNQFRSLDRKENLKIYTEPAHSLHGRSIFDTLQILVRENYVHIVPIRLNIGIEEL